MSEFNFSIDLFTVKRFSSYISILTEEIRFLTGRAVFIRISLGIALLRYVVSLKTSRHFVVQSGIKPNPMVTRRPHSSVSCQFISIPFEFSLVQWIVYVLYDWQCCHRSGHSSGKIQILQGLGKVLKFYFESGEIDTLKRSEGKLEETFEATVISTVFSPRFSEEGKCVENSSVK